MSPRRTLGAVALAASAAFLAACTSGVTVTSAPPSAPVSTASTASTGGSAAGPCALLTAPDIQTALGESVTATNAPAGASTGTAQVQECVLTTDGPPLAGSSAGALSTLAGVLTGGQSSPIDLTSGGVAVVVANTPFPISASAAPGSLPAGITAVPGVGLQAYVLASPTGGGIAVAEVSAGTVVLILDLEGKQVTTAQLTTLLTAAVARS